MARINVPGTRSHTHEGGKAQKISPYAELERTVMTCLLWEDSFYESGESTADRIQRLVPKVKPGKVAALAIAARSDMQLRHVPLLLVRELARSGHGGLVSDTLFEIIQRPDELTEFMAIYWKDGRCSLSAGVKKGLARAFKKFNAYQLAKYNRDTPVKLRDVLFMVHAKPRDKEQEATWKKLVNKTLEVPDTWEVALSGGADKKETFERLLKEGTLGGMAVLRNLRNMQQAGVDEKLIRERLVKGVRRALPFRFVTAARYAPRLEDSIEVAMLKALEEHPRLKGTTGILIDVSGSMDYPLSSRGDTTRMDAAAGLSIMLREICEVCRVATFSLNLVELPARRGFALRDAITSSQQHSGTLLKSSLDVLAGDSKVMQHDFRGYYGGSNSNEKPVITSPWTDIDRLIVVTDEQSHDGSRNAWIKPSYMINVATYQNGVGYGNGWTHISGWSNRIVDYIQAMENVD